MIEYSTGDIFDANAEALVNPVNCVGVAGAGLALQFRKRFPYNYKCYRTACKSGAFVPGTVNAVGLGRAENPKVIINFPTKRHYKDESHLVDIETGLVALVQIVRQAKIASIAIPPLGCGLGGLDWTDVLPLIVRAFEAELDVRTLIYAFTVGR